MTRTAFLLLTILLGTADSAFAQASAPSADSAGSASTAAPNVAATGKHMPDVGASKSAGVTTLDKQVEKKMQKDTSICKGC